MISCYTNRRKSKNLQSEVFHYLQTCISVKNDNGASAGKSAFEGRTVPNASFQEKTLLMCAQGIVLFLISSSHVRTHQIVVPGIAYTPFPNPLKTQGLRS